VSTILFSDLVESTSTAARLGDQHWHDVLDAHNAAVRRQLERFEGREVDTTGDGFFAIFEGPAQAIRCAEAMRDVVGRLGLRIRIGIHTGQIELTETGVLGLGVHIGQRVSSLASSARSSSHAPSSTSSPGPASSSPTAENISSREFQEHGEFSLCGPIDVASTRPKPPRPGESRRPVTQGFVSLVARQQTSAKPRGSWCRDGVEPGQRRRRRGARSFRASPPVGDASTGVRSCR
jgi:class 3 adenylate cyclase